MIFSKGNIINIVGIFTASIVSIYFSFKGVTILGGDAFIGVLLAVSISFGIYSASSKLSENKLWGKLGLLAVIALMMVVSIFLNFAGNYSALSSQKSTIFSENVSSVDSKIEKNNALIKQYELDVKKWGENNKKIADNAIKRPLELANIELSDADKKIKTVSENIRRLEQLISRNIKPKGNGRRLEKEEKKLESIEAARDTVISTILSLNAEYQELLNKKHQIKEPVLFELSHKKDDLSETMDGLKIALSYVLSLVADLLAALFSFLGSASKRDREKELIVRAESLKKDVLRAQSRAQKAKHEFTGYAHKKEAELAKTREKLLTKEEQLKVVRGELLQSRKITKELDALLADVSKGKMELSEKLGAVAVAESKEIAKKIKRKAKENRQEMLSISSDLIIKMIKNRQFVVNQKFGTFSKRSIHDHIKSRSKKAVEAVNKGIESAISSGLIESGASGYKYISAEITKLKIVGNG